MKKGIYILILFLMAGFIASAQQIPAKDQSEAIVLVGGTLHVGNGTVIENADIGFNNGLITFAVDVSTIKLDTTTARIIDIKGKHVYPGLISPISVLGLNEIDAVRATRDYRDVGQYNPELRSIIAYSTDSRVTPTVRSNGILIAQITPQGGVISGTSSIVELDGWNWEDAVVKMEYGVHLNWPGMFSRSGWWAEPGSISLRKDYISKIRMIEAFFTQAKAYSTSKVKEKNLKFEAMRGLFDETSKLFVHANYSRQITSAVEFGKKFGVKIVIVGGRDSWMLTDMLKENDIPVILTNVHSLPSRSDDDIDLPFKTPKLLHDAGILYCLSYKRSWQQRSLMFVAGTTAAYGLTKEQALMSITSNTAKILGIEKIVGTVEDGKDATIIVSSGDVLDMRTSNIEMAFIRGKEIDLDNKQKALYRKFKTKYEDQGIYKN